MFRIIAFLTMGLFALAACETTSPTTTVGTDGKPLPRAYRIGAGSTGKLQLRMLDSINSLRQAAGIGQVELDSKLNAAAATHSKDMSNQNRPWHFGSDGSSPIDRVKRVGYTGEMLGENISETYETELETLAAWMEQPNTRKIILEPRATKMGFAYYQESKGKIWWTMVMGN